MKQLSVTQMEELNGGELSVPGWLTCGAAVVSTITFFGSIIAGNIGAALYGPTITGLALAECADVLGG